MPSNQDMGIEEFGVDYEADAAAIEELPKSDEVVSRLGQLILEQQSCADTVTALEARLKEEKEKLRTLTEQTLPEAFDAASMSEFVTLDGKRFVVEPFITASLTEGKKPFAIEWLAENGHDELVKPTITIMYGKGERSVAREVAAALVKKHGVKGAVSVSDDVNTTSFKALIRELYDGGETLPLEQLGVYIARRCVVKEAKKGKRR